MGTEQPTSAPQLLQEGGVSESSFYDNDPKLGNIPGSPTAASPTNLAFGKQALKINTSDVGAR